VAKVSKPTAMASLYQVIWRWHFLAGLLVLPFLVMMAITGGAYLFKPELDHLIYRQMEDVPARAQAFAPASAVIARVESAMEGRVIELTPSDGRNSAVRLLVRVTGGEVRTAFADPYDGHVTGSTSYGGVMQVIRKIHSLQRFGFWASCLIEIAAGWAIVLVGTGIFLWWPRGSSGGVVTVRGSPRTRLFWRDLHAVTGAIAAIVILFLAVTGMPWSMFWGDHVQSWATNAHLGEPAPPAAITPTWLMTATMPNMPHTPHAHDKHGTSSLPWAVEQMTSPSSQPLHEDSQPISIDAALARFHDLGLHSGASITLPEGPNGAYVANWRPDRAEETRVVYLDQYTGALLGDVGFKDFGPVAKSIEWGIAVHQGQEFGTVNRYLMLLGCVAIVLLAVAAVMMWWKRRPAGTFGVPPAPDFPGAGKGFVTIVVAVGVLFPLVGASLVIAVLTNVIGRRLRVGTSG
jgi:uncharacterized iron-regulated membrane protein